MDIAEFLLIVGPLERSVVQFNLGDFNAVAPAMDFGVGSFVTPRRPQFLVDGT
jgi:hypothetical protein